MYRQTTHEIEVSVVPCYQDHQSRPEAGIYVWSYDVEIVNHGTTPVKLVRRHWKITNSYGQTLEVTGDGVVGAQPLIHPGEAFAYSSFTNLATATGFMTGTYQMIDAHDHPLEIVIPVFYLDSPDLYSLPN